MSKQSNEMDDIIRQHRQERAAMSQPDRLWYINNEKMDEYGLKNFKSETGTNSVRILPAREKGKYFSYGIVVHFNVGPSSDAFLCNRLMAKHHPELKLDPSCPICDRIAEWRRQGVAEDQLSPMKPGTRFLFFVVDVTTPKTQAKGPQLFDAPNVVEDEIYSLCMSKRTGATVNIADPEEGRVVSFDREGKGRNTKYRGFQSDPDDPIPAQWLDVPSFIEVLKFATKEEMLAALDGTKFKNEEDLEEENKEENKEDDRSEKKKPVKKSRYQQAIEEEQEEEEEDEEEVEGEVDESTQDKSKSEILDRARKRLERRSAE